MTRFFVTPEDMQPEFMVLTGDNAAHAKVLRLKCGEEVMANLFLRAQGFDIPLFEKMLLIYLH